MHTFLWVALLLVIIWLVLKFLVVVTGAALHILWVIAVISFIIWAIGQLRGGGRQV